VFQLHKAKELDEAEYKASLRATTEACAAGTFAWGGDAWIASVQQIPGVVKLTCLLAESAGHPIEEKTVIEIMADPASKAGLVAGIKEVMASCPNFMEGPDREAMEIVSNRNGSLPSSAESHST
jgi:hypothetical protein